MSEPSTQELIATVDLGGEALLFGTVLNVPEHVAVQARLGARSHRLRH